MNDAAWTGPVPPAVPWRTQAGAYAGLIRRRPRPDQRRFVVFAQGRTGSTLLVDLLRNSPGVHCDEEILARPVHSTRLWISAHRSAHRGVGYGFKVKIYQLTDAQRIGEPARWLTAMHARGWSVVALQRRNLLRHVLSNMVAERRGAFVYRGVEPPPVAAFTVDPEHLVHWMQVRRHVGIQEQAALADVPHLTLGYEEDLLDPTRHQNTLDRLCAQLDLPPATARTEVQRTVVGPLDGIIGNLPEVSAALRGTEWARFLDD